MPSGLPAWYASFKHTMTPLITAFLIHQLLHGLVDREAARLLPRWKLLESLQVLRDDRLRRNQDEHVLDEPFDVVARLVLGTLEWIGAQVEQLGRAQRDQRLHPDLKAMRRLFHEHRLVLVVAQAGEIAVIGPVEELASLIRALAGEHVALIVAVEVHLEALAAYAVTRPQLARDLGLARRRHQRLHPDIRRDDL